MAQLLKKGILQPVLGLDHSQPSTLINYQNGFPQNMRYTRGEIRKREGSKVLGTEASPIPGENGVQHVVIYPTSSEAIRLIRCSKQTIEKFNTVSNGWDSILGSITLTGNDDSYWDDAIVNDKLILTNYTDPLMSYSDGDDAVAQISGTPPQCKYLEFLSPYLVAGYVSTGINNHMIVKWPDTNTLTDWSVGNASSALLDHEGDAIRGLKRLNEFCVAYKKNSLYLGRPVSTSEVIKWDLQEVGTGLMNHRCVVEQKGNHYFMGLHDFHVFNGVRSESIGQKIREHVFSSRNSEKDSRHHAVHVKDYDEVWFFIVGLGEDWPSHIWKYNYRYDFWYYDTCDRYRTGTEWFIQSSVTIDDLVGTIDEQGGSIDDYLSTTNAPSYVFGTQFGLTLRLDSSSNNDRITIPIPARYDSMDLTGELFENYKRWLFLDLWASGNALTVYYSTDYGDSWKKVKEVELTGSIAMHRVYFDVVADHIRFRFENKEAGQTFFLRQFQCYYSVREDQGR